MSKDNRQHPRGYKTWHDRNPVVPVEIWTLALSCSCFETPLSVHFISGFKHNAHIFLLGAPFPDLTVCQALCHGFL